MRHIDETLVCTLLAEQFPEFAALPVQAVERQGWDNRSFRVGVDLVARLPSAAAYAAQVAIEHEWLPRLAPLLPVEIPEVVALGVPGVGYPWPWSLRRWVQGDAATAAPPKDDAQFARDLGQALAALHNISSRGGPAPGERNFHRGGDLQVYDAEFRQAVSLLGSRIDTPKAISLWEAALATKWQLPPVWVHGDIALGNLIVRNGKLAALIDFGQTCVGDPACDLAIAWTNFRGESRDAFQRALPLDEATWRRGKAWAMWKAAILASGLCKSNAVEAERAWQTLAEVLASPSK